MTIDIKIAKKGGQLALELYRKRYPDAFASSYARAANRTMAGARRDSMRATSNAFGIKPQKLMNRFFYFGKPLRATRRRLRARMRVLYADFPVKLLRNPSQAQINSGSHPGFQATMPNGHTGFFHRVGRARLKILEVVLPIRNFVRRVTPVNLRRREKTQLPRELATALKGASQRAAAIANQRANRK